MKFIDFFAGIGGFHSGLEQAGHDCVGWVEWDKFARKSYRALYDVEGVWNASDIRAIKTGSELPEADIWCFGSPCQNISLAGNGKGLSGEQSRLFLEVMRLLRDRKEETKPTYLFMENVKNLLSINHGWDFARVVIEIDGAGYDVEWQIINSSWVVPQNRERVFIVGHKRGGRTRRVFPLTTEEIGKERKYNVLKDVLEPNTDEKYNLSKEKLEQIKYRGVVEDPKKINVLGNSSSTGHKTQNIILDSGLSPTLTASFAKHSIRVATKVNRVFDARKNGMYGRNNEILDTDGLSTTLVASQGGGHTPTILIKNGTSKGYMVAEDGDGINLAYATSNTRRGRVQKKRSCTLTTSGNVATSMIDSSGDLLIRRLTPKECWRLQGFEDEQFNKAKATGMSDSQLYKQAGNAVTVPVIKKIAERFKVI